MVVFFFKAQKKTTFPQVHYPRTNGTIRRVCQTRRGCDTVLSHTSTARVQQLRLTDASDFDTTNER